MPIGSLHSKSFDDTSLKFESHHFNAFCDIVAEQTGINLSESKQEMVYRRFAPRIRKLGLKDLGEYCKLLRSNDAAELSQFSNMITTNLTSFFREEHHFKYLVEHILPQLLKTKQASKKIRIWSAGCSTGEEAYSIAMTLRENIPDIARWDAKILATDLDTTCLQKGARGVYTDKTFDDLSPAQLKRWFTVSTVDGSKQAQAKPELQSLISFKHLNLMNRWPFSGQFDVIFCRNVMIYFDKPTQKILIGKFAQYQSTSATLIIGHSENVASLTDEYKLIGQTVYQRK